MELADIKKLALEEASKLQIQWDMIESDPMQRMYFEEMLEQSARMLPDLEYVYTRMKEGKSVVFSDEPTSLPYEDREKYMMLFEDQLFSGYQLLDLLERYNLIKSITEITKDDVQ